MSGQDSHWQQFDNAHAALLVLPSHTVYPVVSHMNLQSQKNAAFESRPGYL